MPFSSHSLLPRDSPSGGKLSPSTIVVIAVVCGCVVILALVLFLWRSILRLFRPNHAAPLPPVQPLAHQREQHLVAFADRTSMAPPSWVDVSLHAPHYFPATNSDISLLQPGTPKDSVFADEVTTAESLSTLPSPLSNSETYLPPPNLVVRSADSPSPSDSSSMRYPTPVSESANNLVSRSESVPHSETASSSVSAASSTRPPMSTNSQTPSPSRSRPRSTMRSMQTRPTSMISYAGSNHSGRTSVRTNSTVIRGAPHSRHSNIQIVMPAPLAPQMTPFGHGWETSSSSNRSSIFVDQWVNGGSANGTVNSRHSNVPSEWNNTTPRRSHRQSLPANLSVSIVAPWTTQEPPPPVPRIPSEFMVPQVHRTQEMELTDVAVEERGRPRLSRPTTMSFSDPEKQLSSDSYSDVSEGRKPRTLRKQRSDTKS
ncbi:hypothetical protein BXZ70DRAFT_160382 [Cristinia sonorae]|uniref:Uncharacterized protein n=1 Tax=Cristinia sonorae TaxID=1940300 RepID=A0A8K0UQN0_9AGAR|nr:hypothetical protein BXZ70DRAFT_160382 [Cristinia sonorae]